MSWSDPEAIARADAEAKPKKVDPVFASMMARIEQMAASGDPCDMLQGRPIQACQPIMQEWGERGVMKRDAEFGAAGALGIVQAFAILLANVLAVVPQAVAPTYKQVFDDELAKNVTRLREHLESKKR